MELARAMTAKAKRMRKAEVDEVLHETAEVILERLQNCTLLGDPIDFENDDILLIAAYELGRYDLKDMLR